MTIHAIPFDLDTGDTVTQPSISPAFTVSADLVRGLIACAVQCGVSRSSLDRVTDHERDLHSNPGRFSGEHILKLWDRILRLSQDPIIGFRMARFAGLKTFGVLGQILPLCPTISEAFKQTSRFAALVSQGVQVKVKQDGSKLVVAVSFDIPESPVRRTISYWGLTNLSLFPQRLTGVPTRPRCIECAFPSPGPAAERSLREHAVFRFGARENTVVFDRGVGDQKVPSADPDLKALVAEVMELHMEKLGMHLSFEQEIKVILRHMMNGRMPTLAALSRQVGVSARTLQRRLALAGTSFQTLLQEVLRESAESLLASGDLSQGEIAFLLGYSEVSAFSRAYRSWTGRPPGKAGFDANS